jgi:hypothetical protein
MDSRRIVVREAGHPATIVGDDDLVRQYLPAHPRYAVVTTGYVHNHTRVRVQSFISRKAAAAVQFGTEGARGGATVSPIAKTVTIAGPILCRRSFVVVSLTDRERTMVG